MKTLLLFTINLLLFTACVRNYGRGLSETSTDYLAQYRDTIVGNFCGTQIDTLICEPIDSVSDPDYKGVHYEWRVFSKNGSVDDLIIDSTTGIHFVSECDLDGDGADEWGFVTEGEYSNWMAYRVYTYKDRKGMLLYNPLAIWLPHLNPEDTLFHSVTAEEVVSKSSISGMVNVKFSSLCNDGADMIVIDTLVTILK